MIYNNIFLLKKMKIILRPMKLIDVGQMMTLNQQCLSENYPRTYWIDTYQKAKNHSFVAVFAKLIIGYVFCNSDTIISVAVSEKYRSKKIGRQLMNLSLNTFDVPVTLHVRVSNDIAIKLYESLGFITNTALPEYYKNPLEDAYTMIRTSNDKLATITMIKC